MLQAWCDTWYTTKLLFAGFIYSYNTICLDADLSAQVIHGIPAGDLHQLFFNRPNIKLIKFLLLCVCHLDGWLSCVVFVKRLPTETPNRGFTGF